jgi:signal transduction histidine kinase
METGPGPRPALAIIEAHPSIGTAVRWYDNTVTPCTLTPPLEELLSTLTAWTPWVTVELEMGRAEKQSAIAMLLPGDHNRALLVWAETTAGLAAPMVENLVNQIAHDLRNYAFTIGLQAEMGGRRSAGMPEVRGHFEAVLRHVDVLRTYLDWMLLFGRQVRLSPAKVDVAEFLREEVRQVQFAQEAHAPPVSLTLDVPEGLPAARWDRKAIGAALRAVLDNALRSASPPPPVVIRAAADGDDVALEITDQGAGIPPETLAKLTAPMAVRRAGGAGLGLAIARKILRAHGGTLSITSGPGGTTVRLRLPREVHSE